MATKTTGQKRADLMNLSTSAKNNIFQMLKLVDEILADHDYVERAGGEVALLDEFQEKDFSHFGGNPSISAMLRAFRANPKKATWEQYDFNIRVMIDLATPELEVAATERTNWKAECARLQERVAILEQQLAAALGRNDELQQRIGQLKLLSSAA